MNRIFLILCTCSIFAIGLVMIFSTTSAEVLDHGMGRSPYMPVLRQFLYGCAGLLLACCAYKIGYQKIIAYSPYLLAFFTFLLVLVLIPGVGRAVNGSRRWLSLGGVSFQPSEIVKYLVPAVFIYRLQENRGKPIDFSQFFRWVGVLGIPIGLIMVEPNNGTAGVVCLALGLLFFLGHISFKYWAWPVLACLLIGGAFASQLPYVSARLKVYMHPESDLKGRGHQPYQAKIAAGSGRLFGKGPGNSLQKLSYLPEAQNDYIAAIYAEEFGFMGILALILLYMSFGVIGYGIANQACDKEGFYLASVITFLICFQAFLNLGVVSGLLPSTGLNLPLFSQGGSSLMANILGLGILASVQKKAVTVVY
jgi:cell division protein FtsW